MTSTVLIILLLLLLVRPCYTETASFRKPDRNSTYTRTYELWPTCLDPLLVLRGRRPGWELLLDNLVTRAGLLDSLLVEVPDRYQVSRKALSHDTFTKRADVDTTGFLAMQVSHEQLRLSVNTLQLPNNPPFSPSPLIFELRPLLGYRPHSAGALRRNLNPNSRSPYGRPS